MKQYWFKKIGWAYFPTHAMGYAVTLVAIIFIVPVTTAIVTNGYSVSYDLYQLFVYGTSTAFWWKWIAEKISQ